MDAFMSMSPSEFTGEAGTCVFGRCVLIRGPFKPEHRNDDQTAAASSKRQGKGKDGKKGKKGEAWLDSLKTEVHILGGTGIDDVLFLEGWADGAKQLAGTMKRGQVYRIAGAKNVDSKPRYSTSRLPFFLRIVPPLGMNTKIEA